MISAGSRRGISRVEEQSLTLNPQPQKQQMICKLQAGQGFQ